MASISPAERFPLNPLPAGPGDSGAEEDPTVPGFYFRELDPDVYRDERWCANCGGARMSIDVYEFDSGRLRVCLGCGEERVVRFTRMVA